jgi:hypothetical protein
MVEKSRSLSAEELDLIVFLVASLSSSLAMEEACDAIVVEPHPLPLVTCEAVELQSDIVALSPPPPRIRGCACASCYVCVTVPRCSGLGAVAC